MKNSPQSDENGIVSNKSFYHQNKPVILGMGSGVLLGVFMGSLLNDPALGMAFGLAVGGCYWYTLKKQTTDE